MVHDIEEFCGQAPEAEYLNAADYALDVANKATADERVRTANEGERQGNEDARKANEDARVLAEGSIESESGRAWAEKLRADAEAERDKEERKRVTAESGRSSAEGLRAIAEINRNTAETSRSSAESDRIVAEDERQKSEKERGENEDTRVKDEQTRISNESAREVEESKRAASEGLRVSAEESRESAESSRADAEKSRETAEDARVQAEKDRVDAEIARENNMAGATSAANVAANNANTAATNANTAAQRVENIEDHLVFEGEDSILAPEFVEVGDAINRANAAAAGAEKVNATLSGTNLTITNRNGQSTTINTKGETGAKGDKGDKGDQGDVSLSQLNAVKDELQSEITELVGKIDSINGGEINLDLHTFETISAYVLASTKEVRPSSSSTSYIVPLKKGDKIAFRTNQWGDSGQISVFAGKPQIGDIADICIVGNGTTYAEKSHIMGYDGYVLLTERNVYPYEYCIKTINGGLSAVESLAYNPRPLSLEFGELWTDDGNIKSVFSTDFFNYARSRKFFKAKSLKFAFPTKVLMYDADFSFLGFRSLAANQESFFSLDNWLKVLIDYRNATSEQKNLLLTDINLFDESANVVPSNSARYFQYAVHYQKGRGLYEDGNSSYDETQNALYSDMGRLSLPPSYTPTGKPTKIIFYSHGTSGWTSITQKEWAIFNRNLVKYLNDEGYAVFDVFGNTSKVYGTAYTTDCATPINLASKKAALEWICNNFNIEKECYVIGKSQGGLIANIAFCKYMPVKAIALFAPLLTQVNDKYAPWGFALEDTRKSLSDLGFHLIDGYTSFDLLAEDVYYRRGGYVDVLSANRREQCGLIPLIDGITNETYDALFTKLLNSEFKTIGAMDDYIRHSDVPIKIWVSPDDEQINYAYCWNFIKSLQNGGSLAELRVLPSGTGGHDSMDTSELALKSSVVTKLGVQYNAIPRAFAEAVNFFDRF